MHHSVSHLHNSINRRGFESTLLIFVLLQVFDLVPLVLLRVPSPEHANPHHQARTDLP